MVACEGRRPLRPPSYKLVCSATLTTSSAGVLYSKLPLLRPRPNTFSLSSLDVRWFPLIFPCESLRLIAEWMNSKTDSSWRISLEETNEKHLLYLWWPTIVRGLHFSARSALQREVFKRSRELSSVFKVPLQAGRGCVTTFLRQPVCLNLHNLLSQAASLIQFTWCNHIYPSTSVVPVFAFKLHRPGRWMQGRFQLPPPLWINR